MNEDVVDWAAMILQVAIERPDPGVSFTGAH
jgi:hypothetical protein